MKQERGHVIDLLFTLALFCVFAASSFLVVLMGANIYKQTVTQMTQNYNTRTSLSYLAEKIRQNDITDGIRIGEVEGATALVLEQKVGESTYQTWIYSSGGELREVMVAQGAKVKAADGQPIMELADLQVDRSPEGLLSLTTIDPDGTVSTLKLSLRCESK